MATPNSDARPSSRHPCDRPTRPQLAAAGYGSAMKDPVIRAIGRAIQAQREQREMTRLELGLEIGVSHEQMRKYELGTNRVSAARLLRIAEALDVPVSVLFTAVEGNG